MELISYANGLSDKNHQYNEWVLHKGESCTYDEFDYTVHFFMMLYQSSAIMRQCLIALFALLGSEKMRNQGFTIIVTNIMIL